MTNFSEKKCFSHWNFLRFDFRTERVLHEWHIVNGRWKNDNLFEIEKKPCFTWKIKIWRVWREQKKNCHLLSAIQELQWCFSPFFDYIFFSCVPFQLSTHGYRALMLPIKIKVIFVHHCSAVEIITKRLVTICEKFEKKPIESRKW